MLHALLLVWKRRTLLSRMQNRANQTLRRGLMKRAMVTTKGQVLTTSSQKSQECANSTREGSVEELKHCSSCKETLYCSRS